MAERYQKTLAIIKDALLIDSSLLVNFWIETMDTSNYLQNRLSTKCSKRIVIPEEAWTGNRQNVQHYWIFGYKASIFIPSEKRTKSDIHKTQKVIFIGNTDTSKHVRVWTPQTHQVLVASELILNKKQRKAHLLIEHLMPSPKKPLKILPEEPKLCGQP